MYRAPNPLPPDRMTAAERRREVCAILARGVVRLRQRDAQAHAVKGEIGLHFFAVESVHANRPDRRNA